MSREGKTPALHQGLFFELEDTATQHLCPVFITGRLLQSSSSLSSGFPFPVLCLSDSAGNGPSTAIFLAGYD